MSDTILVDHHEGWVEITLNRPDKLNSFTDEMHIALRTAIESARDGGARAILLTGAGRGFCAGQDLGDRDPRKMTGKPDLSQSILNFYGPLIKLIKSLEFPVVCAVNGVAAGAGANIAFACDMVFAGASVKFIESFANVGLIPDAGGAWTLARTLGPARAKGLALTARPIAAAEAQDWGLIWEAVPDADLMTTARAMTAKLAAGPTLGFGLTKHAIEAAFQSDMNEALAREARFQKRCGASPDYAEGVTAFMEKRKPNFTGKAE